MQPLSLNVQALKILRRAAEALVKYTAAHGAQGSHEGISAWDQRLISVVSNRWASMMSRVSKHLLM